MGRFIIGGFTICRPAAFPRVLPAPIGKTISNPLSMILALPATVARRPRRHGTHHYHFKVAALDVAAIDPPAWAKVADVWRVAKKHVIGEAELVGTYSR